MQKEEKKDGKFRVSSSIILVTYIATDSNAQSMCGLTRKTILDHYEHTFGDLSYAVVCKEIAPKTGNIHYHAYIEFLIKLDCRSRSKFLVNGVGVNIRRVRSSPKDRRTARAYCLKEDKEPLEQGKFTIELDVSNYQRNKAD